jgi:hypothetical protein
MVPTLYHYSSNHYSSNPGLCASDCGDGAVPVPLTVLTNTRPTLSFVPQIAAMAPSLYHYSSNHYSSNPSLCVSDCGDGAVPVPLTRPTIDFVSQIAAMAPCLYRNSSSHFSSNPSLCVSDCGDGAVPVPLTRPTIAFVSQIAAMAPCLYGTTTVLTITRPTLAFVSQIAAMAPCLYRNSSNHYSSNHSLCVSDCGDGAVPVPLQF